MPLFITVPGTAPLSGDPLQYRRHTQVIPSLSRVQRLPAFLPFTGSKPFVIISIYHSYLENRYERYLMEYLASEKRDFIL